MTALLAAACAGLAAWFSMGALAVATGVGASLIRVGLLPPVWLLPVLIAACVASAWIAKLSPLTALPLFSSLLLVLPWIPGHVPPAFLMWTGRVAICVWVCIGVAMLALRSVPMAWARDPHRAPRVAAAIACALYIGSAWWLADILPGGDEPHYLIITQSLLRDRDLQIENNHARGDYSEYFRGELRPDYLRRGTNGQIYSIHAPGLSVVIAPAYALRGYHGVIVFLSIVAALGGAIMWTAAYRLTESPGAAWFSWAAWAMTVPCFFQAFSVFPDGIGATLVLFAALPLLPEKGAVPLLPVKGVRPLFLSGVALALLPWLHTRFAIIAVVLGACIVLRLIGSAGGRSKLLPFLAVPVASAVAWFAFFRVIYGTFSPAAPYNGYTQSSLSNILTGLPALMFDQQFGILPYAPVYGFCLFGMASLARKWPRLAVELSLTALLYLMSSSAYHMWWGGSSAPARFAVPVLPLLVLPAGWLWKSARHPATRAIGFALLVASIGVTALTVTVDGGQLAYNFRDGYSRFAEWLSPLVDLPQALPSFFRQTSGGAVVRGLIWSTSIALVWFALKRVSSRPWLALATPVCVAIAAMLSTTIVWKLQNVPGPTPDTSQLNLLGRVDPRMRPTGFDLARAVFIPAETVVSGISISTPRRRPPPPASTLLLVPGLLPAGTYALVAQNPSGASGMARLVIGRYARPIVSWNLRTDLRDGAVRFDLPVNVGSIVVEGDDEAARAVKALSLRPIELVAPASRLTADYARRVERYSSVLAYFFDDGAFVEEPGFWVRGGSGTRVAAMPDQPGAPLQLFLRNAPVVNRVRVDIDGHAETLELQPREERMVPVPISSSRRAALVHIQSDAGFRPSVVEPGSTDNRYLGVWIELRQ